MVRKSATLGQVIRDEFNSADLRLPLTSRAAQRHPVFTLAV